MPSLHTIPPDVKFIFVSDFFVEDYVGGAELTSEALIQSAPYPLYKIHARDVTTSFVQQNLDKHWIFGNFATLDRDVIINVISSNIQYSVLEYDYKFCKFRSPEKHEFVERRPCDCAENQHGKLVATFFAGAKFLWFMSERQQERYVKAFPELGQCNTTVLSSVFDNDFFVTIDRLRKKYKTHKREGWIVLGSNSWVKGFEAARDWCEKNNKQYEVVWDLPYDVLLDKLAAAEGFVYLPAGGDTCPRMVIEAMLLGCKLHTNDNVEHVKEDWFQNVEDAEAYLFLSRSRFWAALRSTITATISGYTTTYNCLSQKYPFVESISSMLGFCDEVCIVDGGSADGTWEKLTELEAANGGKVKIKRITRDWEHPRHAVFDGAQKAEARKMCTMNFCWQQDSDEIVHEEDYEKIKDIAKRFPTNAALIALPVTEFWGSHGKVRADINPWKWRMSRNDSDITHGIPRNLRRFDSDGNMFAAPGTDGCDYVFASSGENVPFVTFFTEDVAQLKHAAMMGNAGALASYEQWFNYVISQIPGVFHFSWWNIERKITTYKGYWAKHWKSLFDVHIDDTAENNTMFDKKWADVTHEDIKARAKELEEKTGGWIWHSKWNGSAHPHISVNRSLPRVIINWATQHAS